MERRMRILTLLVHVSNEVRFRAGPWRKKMGLVTKVLVAERKDGAGAWAMRLTRSSLTWTDLSRLPWVTMEDVANGRPRA